MHDNFVRRALIGTVPLEAFRTSRDPARSWRQASVVMRGSEWWLIHPEIASRCIIPGMFKADFHDCVYRDGFRFILAIFKMNIDGLQATLNDAISLAQDQWVLIEHDESWKDTSIIVEETPTLIPPPWPLGSFMNQLRSAFQGRCICSLVELEAMFHEPSADPVFDIYKTQFPPPPKVVRAARLRTSS